MDSRNDGSRPQGRRKGWLVKRCQGVDAGGYELSLQALATASRALGSPIDAGELSRINLGARPLLPKHAATLAKVFASYGKPVTARALIRAHERYVRSLAPVAEPSPLPREERRAS